MDLNILLDSAIAAGCLLVLFIIGFGVAFLWEKYIVGSRFEKAATNAGVFFIGFVFVCVVMLVIIEFADNLSLGVVFVI